MSLTKVTLSMIDPDLQGLVDNKFFYKNNFPAREAGSDTFTIIDGTVQSEPNHYHGTVMCEGFRGNLYLIYRRGTEHGVNGLWSLCFRKSYDGGKTWTDEQTLKQGTTSNIYSSGSILVTPTGRIIVAYNDIRRSGGTTITPTNYDTLISEDDGETWVAGAQIDSINYTYARLFGRMKVFPYQNALGYRLGVTAYHQVNSVPEYTSTIYYSDDNGESWAEGTPIYTGTNGDNETEFIYLNKQVGFAVTRASNARLFKTEDGGVTWALVGTMDSYTGAADSVAPTLDKFCKDGIWYVLLGMFQRDFDRLDWSVAAAWDLLTDANAWSGAIDANIGYGNASGYQSPAARVDGTLDVEGGFSYVIIEEFVGTTDSKVNMSYIDLFKQIPLHPKSYEVTSGAITLTSSRLEPVIRVDTEGGASTDDLTIINGGYNGQIVCVLNQQTTSTRDVTLKSGVGNLTLNGDYTLLDTNSKIILQKVGNDWVELGRKFDQVAFAIAISSGVLTIPPSNTTSRILVVTEGGAATDDLDTINGGVFGQVVILSTSSSSNDVTYKDATGNLDLAGDFTSTRSSDTITLVCNGATWVEVSRSDNLA